MRFKTALAAMAALAMASMASMAVSAASDDGGEGGPGAYRYHLSYTVCAPDMTAVYREYDGTVESPYRIGFIITGATEVYDISAPAGALSPWNKVEVPRVQLVYHNGDPDDASLGRADWTVHRVFRYKNKEVMQEADMTEPLYPHPYARYAPFEGMGSGYQGLDTDIPIFRTPEGLERYLLTGDASAAMNLPSLIDRHDFSADSFDPSMPIPDLRFISYDGFTVTNNVDSGYYVDVVAESVFYGLKIERRMTVADAVMDPEWRFATHHYNFADCGMSGKDTQVRFSQQHGASPRDGLIQDFKEWSLQYPDSSHLPGYSRLVHPDDRLYGQLHVHGYPSAYGSVEEEEDALRCTGQAQVSYYVRFRDESGRCGRWVLYTYLGKVAEKVTIGDLEDDGAGGFTIGPDGRPVIKDSLEGTQTMGGGTIDFSGGSAFSILDFLGLGKVGDLFDHIGSTLDRATGALGSFGSLMSACFGFLPGELIGFIILGIVLMILAGVIKAVI